MATYWFKRKRYGWGLRPATWQGWASFAVFVVLVVLNAMRLDTSSHSASGTLLFMAETILVTLIFIAIAYWKGEEPWW